MFINKALAHKKIKQAETEIKRLNRLIKYQKEEKLAVPSEYKLIHKICTKYDIPPDVELYINSFLQKSKMKQVYGYIENIGFLRSQPEWNGTQFYSTYRKSWGEDEYLHKGKGGLRQANSYQAFRSYGREKYRFDRDEELSKKISTGYGLSLSVRDKYEVHYHNYWSGTYNVKNEVDKKTLIKYLDEYKIPYKERDSRHALLCRLLEKDPKDPVYTKEVKARVGRG